MLNEKEFEFLGITKWHKAGYKGQGIKIASKECIQKNTFDDIHTFKYENDDGRFSVHGTRVMDYIRQVCPDAYKIAFDMQGSSHNGVLTSAGADFILKEKPDIITSSQWGNADMMESRVNIYKQLAKDGAYFVCAAGNDDYNGVVKVAKDDFWKAIGACRYNNGKVTRAPYSAVGEELDFMCLDNLYATIDSKRHSGTSFASPLFAGMLALIQCFFLGNINRKLSKDELEKFVKANCVDLGDMGFDKEYGNGLLILPDPASILPSSYGDTATIEETFAFLVSEGELLEPEYWKQKIKEEDKIKWLFIKWANAVRMANKDKKVISNYNIKEVINALVAKGLLLEPQYWLDKIKKEDKIKWLFFKWYNATERVM